MRQDARPSSIRVVIADDHALLRQSTRELLAREQEIEIVGEAADGEEAVRISCQLHPDVAILDIAMPRMNGIEATRRIKEQCPNTFVVILTSYNLEDYMEATAQAGASGYVLKTASYSELVSVVRSVCVGAESRSHKA